MTTTASSGDSEVTGDTTGMGAECGATIYGDISVANSLDLEQLAGISYITGSLTIAANLGPIPQLACLEEVKSLTINSGNDYTAMQSLRVAESITLSGSPDTMHPEFTELIVLAYLNLSFVGETLAFPQISNLVQLSLTGSSSPQFADDFVLTLLFLSENQGDHSTLDGVAANYVDVIGYLGDSLPAVLVDTRLSVFDAPNLASLAVDFGSTFPAVPPATFEEEGNVGVHINNSALVNLDDLASISTYTSRPSLANNPFLADISGLTGASVSLSYVLPPNAPGVSIGGSPKLCLSHAEMVTSTMTLPAAASLYGLNDGC